MKQTKKAAIGTVVRVETSRGYGYMQYMGETPHYGPTVRVLPGCFRRENVNLDKLIAKDGYLMFYFFQDALRFGDVTVVDVRNIPADYTAPRRTRTPRVNEHGQTGEWEIVIDGDINNAYKNVRKTLSSQEKRLPIAEWIPHQVLVERIATRWKPENEKPVAALENRPGYKPPKGKKRKEREIAIEHFLYFPTEVAASKGARRLKRIQLSVEQRKAADDKNWLVLARHTVKPSEIDLEIFDLKLTKIAEDCGGEYDGREINLDPE